MAKADVVVNASPLILLGKIDRIYLLEALGNSVLVPFDVGQEVAAKSEGERIVRRINSLEKFQIVDRSSVTHSIGVWDLGLGETQVIAKALDSNIDTVVLDDRQARRCAKIMELRVLGTLGVIGKAKNRGIIEKAYPIIEELLEAGMYVTDDVIRVVLEETGEV